MAKLNRPVVVLVVALVTLLGAGIAVAAVGDEVDPEDAGTEEQGDTLFNYGYDSGNHIFLFNHSKTDSDLDCTLGNGVLIAGYGVASDDGVIPVDALEHDDADDIVTFHSPDASTIGEELAASGSSDYSGADGTCGISGAVVGGPQGQINHGQFMRLFNTLVDMQGGGCLNRWLARSDLGKGDQKLLTPDVDPEPPLLSELTEGTVEFVTEFATCEHGKKDKTDSAEHGNGHANGHGKSGLRGKSVSAPGHNK